MVQKNVEKTEISYRILDDRHSGEQQHYQSFWIRIEFVYTKTTFTMTRVSHKSGLTILVK